MKILFVSVAFIISLLLTWEASGLDVGAKAPLFEGVSTQGVVRLSDYFGKKVVVLAFYFKDFTSG
jgi:peroxiredoxin